MKKVILILAMMLSVMSVNAQFVEPVGGINLAHT